MKYVYCIKNGLLLLIMNSFLLLACTGGKVQISSLSSLRGVNAQNSPGTVTTPKFTLQFYASPALEGQALTFFFTLSQSQSEPVSIEYSTSNGSGVAGTHYTESKGVLNFNPGETSKTISVPTVYQAPSIRPACSPDLDFLLYITRIVDSSGKPIVATPNVYTKGLILESDLPSISISNPSALEGSNLEFVVTLTGTCLGRNVTFDWQTQTASTTVPPATAAHGVNLGELGDYTIAGGAVSIPPGSTQTSLIVYSQNDSLVNGSRVFNLNLSNISGASSSSTKVSGLGTIMDNDTAILSVTSNLANSTASLFINPVISLSVNFNNSININTSLGNPYLELNSGPITSNARANFTGLSADSKSMLFSYSVRAGDNATTLDVLSPTALNLNGASLSTASGGTVLLAPLPIYPGNVNSLGTSGIVVDTVSPILAATSSSGPFYLNSSKSASFSFSHSGASNFPSNVTLGSSIVLTATGTANCTTKSVTGSPGSISTPSNYTLTVNQCTGDGQITVSIPANSATDPGLNPANALVLGTLVIDNSPPLITSVIVQGSSNYYSFGSVLTLNLAFDGPVIVTPGSTGNTKPLLVLGSSSSASSVTSAAYTSATGVPLTSIQFTYTVQPNDNFNLLTAVNLLTNGATLLDQTGNSLNIGAFVFGVLLNQQTPSPQNVTLNGMQASIVQATNTPLVAPTTPIPFGQTLNGLSITIKNSGGQNANLQLPPTVSNPFSLVNHSCSTTLAPQATCVVNLNFVSPGATSTPGTGVLSIAYDPIQGRIPPNYTTQFLGGFGFSFPGAMNTAPVAPIYKGYLGFGGPIGQLASTASWNDYVMNDGPTLSGGYHDTFGATGSVCVPSLLTDYNSCIHGGEKFWIDLAPLTVCTSDLSVIELLGAFEWSCVERNGHAYFATLGLKEAKGLSDLLDGSNPSSTSWRSNQVTISKGAVNIIQSLPSTWHNNPIYDLPSYSLSAPVSWATFSAGAPTNTGFVGSGPIATHNFTGNILVAKGGDVQSSGYNLDADSLALVTLPNSSIRFNGTPGFNLNKSNGTTVGSLTNTALVSSGNHKFIWIEGQYQAIPPVASPPATTPEFGLYAKQLQHSIIRNSYVNGASLTAGPDGAGIQLELSHANSISRSSLTGNSGSGLNIKDSFNNTIRSMIINNNSTGNNGANSSALAGILINGLSPNNHFTQLQISNNYGDGISIAGAFAASLPMTSDGTTFSHITLVNNGFNPTKGSGLSILGAASPANITLNNVLVLNSSYSGLSLQGTNIVLSQVESLFQPFDITGTTPNGLTNLIKQNKVLANTCIGLSGTNLTITSPAGTNCVGVTSGFNSTIFSSNMPFLGGLMTLDPSNSYSNSTGQFANVLVGVITDWMHFSNSYRSWIPHSTAAFPNGSAIGTCRSGTCDIWDWRLKTPATVNPTNNPIFGHSGAITLSSTSCSTFFAAGDFSLVSDNLPSGHLFVSNALEIIGDGIGNENGLCEIGEDCLWAPHLGAYQGEGNIKTNGFCLAPVGTPTAGTRFYIYPTVGL